MGGLAPGGERRGEIEDFCASSVTRHTPRITHHASTTTLHIARHASHESHPAPHTPCAEASLSCIRFQCCKRVNLKSHVTCHMSNRHITHLWTPNVWLPPTPQNLRFKTKHHNNHHCYQPSTSPSSHTSPPTPPTAAAPANADPAAASTRALKPQKTPAPCQHPERRLGPVRKRHATII